jgi:hypothetical protein
MKFLLLGLLIMRMCCRSFSTVKFKCSFNVDVHIIYNKTSNTIAAGPSVVWSHLGEWMSEVVTTNIHQPSYPQHVVLELNRIQINFQAGTVFNEDGCISSHSISGAQDWQQRQKYMRTNPSEILTKNTVFDYEDGIFLWGSMYATDFQHAVIDFLPLFDTLLRSDVLIKKPDIPIITGPYVRFFERLYPFNLFQFVYRDHLYKQQGGTVPVPTTFRHAYFVDLIEREQSYVLPGSYDMLLPFLRADFQFDPKIHNLAYLQRHVLHFNSTESRHDSTPLLHGRFLVEGRGISDRAHAAKIRSSEKRIGISSNGRIKHTKPDLVTQRPQLNTSGSHRFWVVYLDRSALIKDPLYIKTSGQVNGRSVVNQSTLLEEIQQALLPPYRLVVHSCTDWKIDRQVMRHAAVLIGPHGGHFTNMIFASKGTHVVEFGRSVLMRAVEQEVNRKKMRVVDSKTPSRIAAARSGKQNPRWVFVGLANAMGLKYWTIEDMLAVRAYRQNNKAPLRWSDRDMVVSTRQVLDTLRAIGVAK